MKNRRRTLLVNFCKSNLQLSRSLPRPKGWLSINIPIPKPRSLNPGPNAGHHASCCSSTLHTLYSFQYVGDPKWCKISSTRLIPICLLQTRSSGDLKLQAKFAESCGNLRLQDFRVQDLETRDFCICGLGMLGKRIEEGVGFRPWSVEN